MLRIVFYALQLAAPTALAQQNYPQKPIRYVVPFPAGGIADVFARIIGGEAQPIELSEKMASWRIDEGAQR